MEELLEFSASRFETLELGTENPEYYEPFGFRIVPEHRFIARTESPGGRAGFRAFEPDRRSDLELLDRLLDARTPVSNRVGIVAERDVFKFSQGSAGLHYSEALDCLAVLEIDGGRLTLSDVVACKLPTLEALLAEFAHPIDEVEFHFCPDRFEVDARPELFRYDGDCYMVRGPFEAEGETFMVPPPARH